MLWTRQTGLARKLTGWIDGIFVQADWNPSERRHMQNREQVRGTQRETRRPTVPTGLRSRPCLQGGKDFRHGQATIEWSALDLRLDDSVIDMRAWSERSRNIIALEVDDCGSCPLQTQFSQFSFPLLEGETVAVEPAQHLDWRRCNATNAMLPLWSPIHGEAGARRRSETTMLGSLFVEILLSFWLETRPHTPFLFFFRWALFKARVLISSCILRLTLSIT